MDADGSGSIDVDEMWEAFQLLKIRVSRQMVGDMLAKVDSDGSGQHWTGCRHLLHLCTSTACRGAAACTMQHAPVSPHLKVVMPSALPQQVVACWSHE